MRWLRFCDDTEVRRDRQSLQWGGSIPDLAWEQPGGEFLPAVAETGCRLVERRGAGGRPSRTAGFVGWRVQGRHKVKERVEKSEERGERSENCRFLCLRLGRGPAVTLSLAEVWEGSLVWWTAAGNSGIFDAVLGDVYNADWIGENYPFWIDAVPNLQEVDCRKAAEVFLATRRTQGFRSFL